VLVQEFFRELLPVGEEFVSTGIGNISAGLGRMRMTGACCVRCILGGVAVR
jgi:hypothetical protein